MTGPGGGLPKPLAGRSAVVTGASSGIGRAIAVAFAAAGAGRIVITYRENRTGADETLTQLRSLGARADALQLDLENDTSLSSFTAALREQALTVHVWVNNAGADLLTGSGRSLSRDEKLDKVLSVDVRGTVRASWAAAEMMDRKTPGGVILNVGWDHVRQGMAGENPVIYSVAKGAIDAFSKSFARELAPHIRVNVLAPGFIDTAFAQEAPASWRTRVPQLTPLARWGTPEDVAAAAVYLASDAAAFVTGQTLMVNGGVVM